VYWRGGDNVSLRTYVAKRLFYAVFLMWLVATTIFVALRLVPGGPAYAILGREATPERVETLRRQLGLNEPFHEQYVDWMAGLPRGNLGESLQTGQPVSDVILNAAPKTLSIGLLALVIGLGIAIPAGVISATRRREWPDYVSTFVAFFGLSAPAFFIGILLIAILGVRFAFLPTFGYTPLKEGVVPWFQSILLPSVAVGLPYTAIIMRMMRSSLLEVLDEQYMKTARAKGMSSRVQLYKHALQNAFIPVVTVAGIQIAVILGGSVTVEIVFGIKGMGRVIIQSIISRDYPVTQGVMLVIAAGLVLINLLVDLMYPFIDPRIRYGGDQR